MNYENVNLSERANNVTEEEVKTLVWIFLLIIFNNLKNVLIKN